MQRPLQLQEQQQLQAAMRIATGERSSAHYVVHGPPPPYLELYRTLDFLYLGFSFFAQHVEQRGRGGICKSRIPLPKKVQNPPLYFHAPPQIVPLFCVAASHLSNLVLVILALSGAGAARERPVQTYPDILLFPSLAQPKEGGGLGMVRKKPTSPPFRRMMSKRPSFTLLFPPPPIPPRRVSSVVEEEEAASGFADGPLSHPRPKPAIPKKAQLPQSGNAYRQLLLQHVKKSLVGGRGQ